MCRKRNFAMLWLLLLGGLVPVALGFCETFKTACFVQIVAPVNDGNEIAMANKGSYYFTLSPTASTPKNLQLVASILYGRVDFYVRFGENNEPSSTSYDLSSSVSGMPDFLGIVSGSFDIEPTYSHSHSHSHFDTSTLTLTRSAHRNSTSPLRQLASTFWCGLAQRRDCACWCPLAV